MISRVLLTECRGAWCQRKKPWILPWESETFTEEEVRGAGMWSPSQGITSSILLKPGCSRTPCVQGQVDLRRVWCSASDLVGKGRTFIQMHLTEAELGFRANAVRSTEGSIRDPRSGGAAKVSGLSNKVPGLTLGRSLGTEKGDEARVLESHSIKVWVSITGAGKTCFIFLHHANEGWEYRKAWVNSFRCSAGFGALTLPCDFGQGYQLIYEMESIDVSRSVVSSCLQPRGLKSARLYGRTSMGCPRQED